MHETGVGTTRFSRRAVLGGAFTIGAGAMLAACGAGNSAAGSNSAADIASTGRKVVVAATTTQLQDWLRNVGGDRVEIVGILKPNVDPHDYEPTAADGQAISRADLIVTHGAGLDAWMDKVIANANSRAPRVVATNGLSLLQGGGEFKGGDPHVWFDPSLVKSICTAIGEGLGRVDTTRAAQYRQNAVTYNGQLDAMDAALQVRYSSIPAAGRKLVTNHEAFQYLARRYGLTIVGAVIPALSDAAEPSAKDINDLIATIKRERVRAIFAESSANPKVAQQVAQEAGVKVVDTLYGDTLGPPDGDGGTYIKMMNYNAQTIVDALK